MTDDRCRHQADVGRESASGQPICAYSAAARQPDRCLALSAICQALIDVELTDAIGARL